MRLEREKERSPKCPREWLALCTQQVEPLRLGKALPSAPQMRECAADKVKCSLFLLWILTIEVFLPAGLGTREELPRVRNFQIVSDSLR